MNAAFVGRRVRVDRVVLANVVSLAGATAVTLPLGFVFWWLAARLYSADSVGVASASIAAMMLLAQASVLGFGTLMVGELPRRRGFGTPLLATAVVFVALVGLAVGCAFAAVAGSISEHLAPLADSAWATVLFGLGVGLTTATFVLDHAMVGVLRGHLQFWRNGTLAAGKLVLLGAFAALALAGGSMTIVAAWVIATGLSIGLLATVFLREGHDPRHWRPTWGLVRDLRGAATLHHSLNIALAAPQYLLPVLATTLLSPREGAYFYTAWMIALVVTIIPGAFTDVLFAIGSGEPERLRARTRETLAYCFIAATLAAAAVMLLGPRILSLFGDGYADPATTPLRILALAGFPLIIRYHFVAVSRATGQLRLALSIVAFTSLLEICGAAVGARVDGLVGLSAGWAAVVCLEAAVMLVPLRAMLAPAPHPAGGPA